MFIVVQSLSRVQLFEAPWTAARQASLSFTIYWSLLKLMSIESMMPSNHLIICHPLLLLPSIFPSIRVFSKESVLHIRWPKYWSFSISRFNEYSGLISFCCCSADSVVSHSLRRHGRQHTRIPCPSPSPKACSNSCPFNVSQYLGIFQ